MDSHVEAEVGAPLVNQPLSNCLTYLDSLLLAEVISASPTREIHVNIESLEHKQLQFAVEEPTIEKYGATRRLIAITTSEASVMTNKVSTIEKFRDTDILEPAHLIEGTAASSSDTTKLIPELDPVSVRGSSWPRNIASLELCRRKLSNATKITTSPVSSPLLHEDDNDAGYCSPLFLSCEAREVSVPDDSSKNREIVPQASHSNSIHIKPIRRSLDILTDSC